MTDAQIEDAILARLQGVEELEDVTVELVSRPAKLQGKEITRDTVLILFNRTAFGDPGKGPMAPSINTQEQAFEVAVAVASKNLRSVEPHKGALALKEIVRRRLAGWQYDGGNRLIVKGDFLVREAVTLGVWMYQITVTGKQTYVMDPEG